MVRFASLAHVALKTRDIEKSLAFYTGQLGMPEMLRLLFDDGSLFLIYLRITDDQYLELFPDGVGDRAPGRDAVAVNHFCLRVEDIERSVADLEAAGVTITREIRTGPDGNRQAWIEDPDGNRIELMEMAAGCLQFQAVQAIAAGKQPIHQATTWKRPVPAA